jgi:serine/threonine-protein kinase
MRAGQTLGRYELLAPVAKGGMGQVWAGRLRGARGFQKLVAIKTLLAATADQRFERMLFDEARIASLIQHSNVVQTMELGEHLGSLYLVMEWVDGDPLSHLLSACEASGGVPLLVAVHLIAQTLRGLQAAHELRDDAGCLLGVVHRDVSPHNVLVSYSGVAKLVDFGIAKAMNQDSSSTTTGEIKGKFAYMAPEQILAAEVAQRADLFAVGIMLYLLTTGRHPFKNHHSAGVLHSISSDEPAPDPRLAQPEYSAELAAVVLKALEKQRDERWASAEEMREALEQAVPEAFALGAETRVRDFMAATLGERAGRKREALRRAEAAFRGRVADSGGLAAVQGSAQSASSLRAVSVDSAADEQGSAPRLSSAPSLHEEPELSAPRGSQRGTKGAVLVACAALGLVASLLWLRRPSRPATGATGSSAQLESLTPRATDVRRAPAPSAVPPAPSADAAAQAPAASAPSSTSASASPSALKSPAHAEDVRRAGAGAPRKHDKAAPPPHPAAAKSEASDLIAPDYAR